MNAIHKYVSEATNRPSLTAKAVRALLALTVVLALLTILPEANHIGEEIPQIAHHICNSCGEEIPQLVYPSGEKLVEGVVGGVW